VENIELHGKLVNLDGQQLFLCPPSQDIGFASAGWEESAKGQKICQIWQNISHELKKRDLQYNSDWFWCQEQGKPAADALSPRCVAKIPAPFVSIVNANDGDICWRPMLIPVTSKGEFDPHVFGGVPNGTTAKMYTLTLDNATVRADVDNPELYMGEGRLTLTDQFFANNTLINWIFCDGIAIADRNLLSNITWKELSQQGLFEDAIDIVFQNS